MSDLPLYRIRRFDENNYKVTKFFVSHLGKPSLTSAVLEPEDKKTPSEKFSQALCRARSVVLDLCLSNHWDYFATITIDKKKHDRFNLHDFNKFLNQWFRDFRKRTGFDVKYILVPERHKTGEWHMHGLFSGLPADCLSPFKRFVHPTKLVDGGYLNFEELSAAVGFVSFGVVKDHVKSAFYIRKYITKEMTKDAGYYTHLYFRCRGLKTSEIITDVFSFDDNLESCLRWNCDFCAIGFVTNVDFSFPLSFDDFELKPRFCSDLVLESRQPEGLDEDLDIELFVPDVGVQQCFANFLDDYYLQAFQPVR